MAEKPDHPPIGEKPPAEAETPELNPGGVDAINDDPPFAGDEHVLGHDLLSEDNPSVDEHVPDEITEPDDKQQETEGSDSGTDEAESENPE